MSRDNEWTIELRDDTVVVTFPEGSKLDQQAGREVNETFMRLVEKEDTRKCLTELYIDDPLDSDVFEELEQAADAAVENGISKWAVVVDARVKGMAFRSQLDGLDTNVFEERSAALEFLREDKSRTLVES